MDYLPLDFDTAFVVAVVVVVVAAASEFVAVAASACTECVAAFEPVADVADAVPAAVVVVVVVVVAAAVVVVAAVPEPVADVAEAARVADLRVAEPLNLSTSTNPGDLYTQSCNEKILNNVSVNKKTITLLCLFLSLSLSSLYRLYRLFFQSPSLLSSSNFTTIFLFRRVLTYTYTRAKR